MTCNLKLHNCSNCSFSTPSSHFTKQISTQFGTNTRYEAYVIHVCTGGWTRKVGSSQNSGMFEPKILSFYPLAKQHCRDDNLSWNTCLWLLVGHLHPLSRSQKSTLFISSYVIIMSSVHSSVCRSVCPSDCPSVQVMFNLITMITWEGNELGSPNFGEWELSS